MGLDGPQGLPLVTPCGVLVLGLGLFWAGGWLLSCFTDEEEADLVREIWGDLPSYAEGLLLDALDRVHLSRAIAEAEASPHPFEDP